MREPPRTNDATGSVQRYFEEANAALRSQVAALNRLRTAHGLPPYVLREDRRAA